MYVWYPYLCYCRCGTYIPKFETETATYLVSFLAERTSRWDLESKGAGAAQVRRKKGCFAHVVNVYHVEHVGIVKHHRHGKGVLDIRYASSWSATNG